MLNRTKLSLAVLTVLALAACRKDKDEATDFDYTSAVDNSRAEQYFDDMLNQVDQAATDNGIREEDDACAPTVTFDTIAMPHTMLVDFGSVNCTASNGRTRRGSIMVSFTGPYRHPGTVITITPQDYYVNDNHVQGTKTVTNMGENADGHLYYTVVVDGTVTAGDGSWTTSHHANRIRTWTEGSDTPSRLDDVYLISGTGNGVNRNGNPYTMTITSPLRIALSCAWITGGSLELTPQDKPTRYVNFGNGSCDATVSVTVNGNTFTFDMN